MTEKREAAPNERVNGRFTTVPGNAFMVFNPKSKIKNPKSFRFSRRFSKDQFRLEDDGGPVASPVDFHQLLDGELAHFFHVQGDGGQGGEREAAHGEVVEPGHGQVLGDG